MQDPCLHLLVDKFPPVCDSSPVCPEGHVRSSLDDMYGLVCASASRTCRVKASHPRELTEPLGIVRCQAGWQPCGKQVIPPPWGCPPPGWPEWWPPFSFVQGGGLLTRSYPGPLLRNLLCHMSSLSCRFNILPSTNSLV